MSEHLACHRTVGASIVMLIASGLPDRGLATLAWPAALTSGGPRGPAFLARFQSPAFGPVRRSVRVRRPSPSTWRFRDRPSACCSGPLFRSAEAPLSSCPSNLPPCGLTASRHSLHLRFARCPPKSFPYVFSDAAAGIVAVSISFSFPYQFQRFPVQTSSAVSSSR